jgi:TetR/AcrR family transcriptional regulator, repressor for neighboring sulfatase
LPSRNLVAMTKVGAPRTQPSDTKASESGRPERGRPAVERRLIDAAADLLAEVGPKQLSMRTLSKRARANSGQVYHYFGSKSALVRAAMIRLVEHHHDHMHGQDAIGLLKDERYWRALGHAVLDGAEDLFRLEIETGMSMPLDYIEWKRAEAGGSLDAAQSADALSDIALTLGWATFEPFLLALIQEHPDPPSRDALRESISEILRARMAGWSGP